MRDLHEVDGSERSRSFIRGIIPKKAKRATPSQLLWSLNTRTGHKALKLKNCYIGFLGNLARINHALRQARRISDDGEYTDYVVQGVVYHKAIPCT